MPTPKKVKYPAVPGLAHGTGPWGLSNAPEGRVVMNRDGGGSFSAPMGSSKEDEAARFRQYANLHLRREHATSVKAFFDGCSKEGVESDVAHAVFMAAVNGFAVQKGLGLEDLTMPVAAEHGAEYLAKAYLQLIGTSALQNQTAQWLAAQAPQVWNVASQCAGNVYQAGREAVVDELDHKKMVEHACKLQQAFGRKRMADAFEELPKSGAPSDLTPEEREKLNKKLNNKCASWLSKMEMSDGERKQWLSSLWGDPHATSLVDQVRELQERIDQGAGGPAGKRWGLMRKRLLTMARRAVRHSFRHRPTFIGAFRYPHRALIPAMDGRAWHAKLVGLGGTLLLDKSSSMGISEESLRELLHRSPLATIACYSGGGSERDSQGMSTGHLTILAKEGRYAAEKVWPEFPGGNVVDGPALRWLAKQARPRVWISDGLVTAASAPSGEQDASADMKLECALLCRMAGITQYNDIALYLKSHHYMSQFK